MVSSCALGTGSKVSIRAAAHHVRLREAAAMRGGTWELFSLTSTSRMTSRPDSPRTSGDGTPTPRVTDNSRILRLHSVPPTPTAPGETKSMKSRRQCSISRGRLNLLASAASNGICIPPKPPSARETQRLTRLGVPTTSSNNPHTRPQGSIHWLRFRCCSSLHDGTIAMPVQRRCNSSCEQSISGARYM